jgi:hypothetical protein
VRSGGKSLQAVELADFLDTCPSHLRQLVLALRRVILRHAPGATEAIRFHCLCYFTPGRHFGAIGGNICMIEANRKGLRLSFIHGATLPDPGGLLQGAAKSKRFLPITTAADIRRKEVYALIRAATASSRRTRAQLSARRRSSARPL